MDNCDPREVEINIEPRIDRLEGIGATRTDFEQLLPKVLEDYHALLEAASDMERVATIEEIELDIKGATVALGEIAHISVSERLE